METAISGSLLRDTLKALGHMAEVKLTGNRSEAAFFTADGFRAMVMPIALPARPQAEGEAQGEGETPPEAPSEEVQETPTEAQEPERPRAWCH